MAILLISFAAFSVRAEVVLPGEKATVSALSLMPSALEELKEQGIFVLFDDAGRPYGFVQNGSFVDEIKYGNLTIKPYSEGSEVIVGSSELEKMAGDVAAARSQLGTSFDSQLLRKEDFLKYVYYNQRYGGLEGYLKDMGLDSKQAAIDFLNQIEPSEANEFLDIYDALDSKQLGYSHYKMLLDALDRLNGEDLSKYMDPEKAEELQKRLDELEKQVSEEMLKELLRNFDRDELKLLQEVLRRVDYKTIYRIARDYVREAARDGTLDRTLEDLKGAEVPDEVKRGAVDAARDFARNRASDFIPKKFAYYAVAIAAIALTFALRGVS